MKKGIKRIVAAGVLLIFGFMTPFSIMLALFIPLFQDKDQEAFIIPGKQEIVIDEPGKYYLWHDYITVHKGRSYSFEKTIPGGLTISLINNMSGLETPLQMGLNISSESGSVQKSSIGYFEVAEPGNYVLNVTGETEQRIFSFGKSGFEDFFVVFAAMGLGMVFCVGTFMASAVLIVLGIISLVQESKTANKAPERTS